MNKQTHPGSNVIEKQQQLINERTLDGFQDREQQSLDENQTLEQLLNEIRTVRQREQQLLNENQTLRNENQTMKQQEQQLVNENQILHNEKQRLLNELQTLEERLSKDIFFSKNT